MNINHVGYIAGGVTVGLLVATLISRRAPSPSPSDQPVVANHLISEVTPTSSELELSQREVLTDAGIAQVPPVSVIPTDMRDLAGATDKFRIAARQRHVNSLIAAGYSMDRIEWLMRRVVELRAEQRKRDEERQLRGLPMDARSFLSKFDEDIGLREEMGDLEYERYRQALGRPVSAGIDGVLPGSVAESVGLRPGDEIVRYGGTRVLSGAELSLLSDEGEKGGSVLVEVLRDGQVMQLTIPRGYLGIRNKYYPPFYLGGAPEIDR